METNYYERDLTEILCLEGILVVVTDTKKKTKQEIKKREYFLSNFAVRLDILYFSKIE